MVDISSGDKKINITVSTSGNKASVNATPDTAMYYSNKSREWAISDKIVSNEDYSSKYYANVSKQNADKSTVNLENLTTNYNQYKNELENTKNISIEEIETAKTSAISDITNQETLSVDNVNTAGATQVALATEQATIATNKASEVIESGNTALSNIDTAKNNAITSITNQETTSKTSLIDEGATQIGLIQNEGATQVANVQSTGFYMRDDKLYFINSQGEETEFKSGGGASRNIGEIVTSSIPLTDAGLHLLDGALIQGSGAYSAFVDYIAELYNSGEYSAIFTTEANWQSTVSTYGICDKFVYDSVNNTVRLPKWGNQAITKSVSTASTVPVVGNRKALGLTNGTVNYCPINNAGNSYMLTSSSGYGAAVGANSSFQNLSGNGATGVTTDPTKSGLVANTSSLLTQYPLSCYYYIVIATSAKTDIQVNIDQIATDVNGKADKDLTNVSGTDVKNAIVSSNVPIITEVYINGNSGHIVYSNKLCEQWGVSNGTGNRTITLTKAYADTNYNLVGSSDSLGNTYDSSSRIVTASTFTIYTQLANNYYWRTIGIIS